VTPQNIPPRSAGLSAKLYVCISNFKKAMIPGERGDVSGAVIGPVLF